MKKAARLRALDNQIYRLKSRVEQLDRTSYRYSWVRIAAFCAGPLVVGLAFFAAGVWLAALCAVAWLMLFGISVYAHRRVKRGIERHRLWLQIKSAQVARAQLVWDQTVSYTHLRAHET